MDTSRDVDREGGIRAELDLHICHWKAIKGWFFLYYELYIHIYLHGSLVAEHVNIVENKTASSPQKREKTFVPKPKQKFVKAVYKVKCSVSDKTDSVKSDNTVLSDKGQFFKYVGPNKVLVPKKV